MTKIQMELVDCSKCPHCYSERFHTEDAWEHETNYYCRIFPDYDKYPKTDHEIDRLCNIRNQPGVIELFVTNDLEPGIPDWCPLKVD